MPEIGNRQVDQQAEYLRLAEQVRGGPRDAPARSAFPSVVLATIAVLLLTACGSSDDGITCGEEQMKVVGTIDGVDVSLTRATTGYVFINKLGDAPGTMDASTAQGTFSLEFNTLTADGQSSPARGSLVDSEGSLSVGNCETGEFPSTLTMDANRNGLHFTLRALHREPYCSAEAVTGELGGCMGFKKF